MITEWRWDGPKRGGDRAVVLAHGAGADMHAASLAVFAEAIARSGIGVLRFHYPYRSAQRRAPDRAGVLAAATRAAADEAARRSGLPPERLILGGRSMGGRYASLIVGDPDEPQPALGLALLGYPLYAPGRQDQPRSSHFRFLDLPVMFVSGDRDAMASWKLLRQHARKVKGPTTFHRIPTGDHGFKPLERRGYTFDAVMADASRSVVEWVHSC